MHHAQDDALATARRTLLHDNGLDVQHMSAALARVMRHQVDFSDIYLQKSISESWAMENGRVTGASFNTDQGFSLRAVRADETAFAFSQHLTPGALTRAALSVRSLASAGNGGGIAAVNVADNRPFCYDGINPLAGRDAQDKVALLAGIDTLARQCSPHIVQVFAYLSLSYSQVMVMRHDGRLAADLRPLLSLQLRVVAERNGRRESASGGLGGREGWTQIDASLIEDEVRRTVASTLVMLDAIPAPAGIATVVIGPGWPGMLLHEAMGHGFEADFNRLGTSIYAGRLGERIAATGVTIVDEGSLPGRSGSISIDDEGEPGQRTVLIENGILKNYMQDSLNARLMGLPPTGNGRRQSYAHLPMPRMTNTYMLAGQYAPEEIIASVKRGVYLADLGSGQVDIVSGRYTFASAEAYLIENGQLTAPVKGATLIGSGPETLRNISMVANDLMLDRGNATCGKAGQSVPVCVGQPTLKIEGLILAGTAV